jgi:hypothetical protein
MTMSASMITPQLLNALVSPDAGIRSQAETVFQSLTVVDRVQGLLTQLCAGDGTEDARLSLLTAVLLRRDILKLGPNHASLLQELVHPLLQAFSSASSCRTQVGHCLAEVCASLSLIGVDSNSNNNNNSPVDQVLPIILSAIQGHLQQGDVPSLKLLAALADRSPVAFSKFAVPSLPSIAPSTASPPPPQVIMETWTEVLVNAAVATTITNISLVRTAPAALDELVVDATSAAA